MAHIINLNWKKFNLNLSVLDQTLRAKYPSYAGNQAHNNLELIFTEDPFIIPMKTVLTDVPRVDVDGNPVFDKIPKLDVDGNPMINEVDGSVILEDGPNQIIDQVSSQEVAGLSIEQEVKEWFEALNEQSPEAVYKSAAEEKAEQDALKQAALDKLAALGLTPEMIKALGV